MQSNKAHLPGSNQEYVISDNAKRYTLKDNFFTETRNGNFQYERSLSKVPNKQAPVLKIQINKTLDELKISSVNAKGLKVIDLYKNESFNDYREFAEFLLQDLVENNVLSDV